MQTDQLTFGSLFAGIGGIDLGFERAGLSCKWQVEIDDYARKVLAKHWPSVRRHDDVRTWPTPDAERVDVIVGGFPCQDISYAGKGAGLGGERSGLFYELSRIVSEMGPRHIVLENVAALLTRGLGDVLGTLASLGYDAEWHCIPAAAVGAPHIRDRVFVLGWNADGKHEGKIGSRNKQNAKSSGDCDRKNKSKSMADADSDNKQRRRFDVPMGWQRITEKTEIYGQPRRTQWETEPAVGRVANGVPSRVDRLKGLGNAVVPQVAELVARRVIAINNRIVKEQNAYD